MTTQPEGSQAAPSATQGAEPPLPGPGRPTTPRCALYARTNGDAPLVDRSSVLRDLLDKRGWMVAAEYHDTGHEPASQFQRMLARSADYDWVVIWDFDVLGRDQAVALAAVQALADRRLSLATVSEGIVESPEMLALVGRLLAKVTNLEEEREAYRRHREVERQAAEGREADDALVEAGADWDPRPPSEDPDPRRERATGGE